MVKFKPFAGNHSPPQIEQGAIFPPPTKALDSSIPVGVHEALTASTHFHVITNASYFVSLMFYFFVAWDSVQNLGPTVTVDKPEVGLVALDSALQEQERIITMSYALASEASLKSKIVAG